MPILVQNLSPAFCADNSAVRHETLLFCKKNLPGGRVRFSSFAIHTQTTTEVPHRVRPPTRKKTTSKTTGTCVKNTTCIRCRSSEDLRRRQLGLGGLSGGLPTRRLRPRLELPRLGRRLGCFLVLRELGRLVSGDNALPAEDVEPFLVRGAKHTKDRLKIG